MYLMIAPIYSQFMYWIFTDNQELSNRISEIILVILLVIFLVVFISDKRSKTM